jgi:hypothetical protein
MARGYETTTGLVIQQGLFVDSATAKHKIGTRMQLADGRVFYYAQAEEGLAAGLMTTMVPNVSGHEDCDVAVETTLNAKTITITPATTEVLKNQYSEGWLCGMETDGLGQTRKIKSHPAASIAANVVITLYDPLTEVVGATGQMNLMKNPFKRVEQTDVEASPPTGLPLIAVTDEYYFWVQTWGVASCLTAVAAPAGSPITQGTTVGSVAQLGTSVASITGYDLPLCGFSLLDGGAGKYSVIMLTLFP